MLWSQQLEKSQQTWYLYTLILPVFSHCKFRTSFYGIQFSLHPNSIVDTIRSLRGSLHALTVNILAMFESRSCFILTFDRMFLLINS